MEKRIQHYLITPTATYQTAVINTAESDPWLRLERIFDSSKEAETYVEMRLAPKKPCNCSACQDPLSGFHGSFRGHTA